MTGIDVRMRRIFPDGKSVVCPLDFGGFVGMVPGLNDPAEAVAKVVEGGADAILVNPGMARSEWSTYAGRTGLIVRVTGGASRLNKRGGYHVLTCSVEEACAIGADAVCIMVFVGDPEEQEMFATMGQVISDAHALGLPVMAELLPADFENSFKEDQVSLCARVGYELGADIIKTYYSETGFDGIVKACRVPIVIAGGPKVADPATVVKQAMECGAAGIAFGRNVYQAPDPTARVRELYEIVHGCPPRGAVVA
ncbi:MAG: putative aldolase LsrF [Firmicutes bacterium ADurb.Bin506]|jgi:DhnA family fructose-bisphosphate aldolase class Ia|nr:MAG: putative aldolase LsrF [Firmicutes bacterium ADurb.Bin506]